MLQAHLIVDVLGEPFLWPQIGFEPLEAWLIDRDEEGPQCVPYQLDSYEQEESSEKDCWVHIIIALWVQVLTCAIQEVVNAQVQISITDDGRIREH